jgi:hypothetical protein
MFQIMRAAFQGPSPALKYLHTIHMERASGDVDWESLWTTLTFEVS